MAIDPQMVESESDMAELVKQRGVQAGVVFILRRSGETWRDIARGLGTSEAETVRRYGYLDGWASS